MPPTSRAASLYSYPESNSNTSNLQADHQQQVPKRSTSTGRLSQRIKSNLRHLRLGVGGGSNHHDEQKVVEPEFKIVHAPDRPSRLISPLEAPSEEECFDDISGWHSAAATAAAGDYRQSPYQASQRFLEEVGRPGVQQVPLPPQLPPVEFDGHRFGSDLGIGLGVSPLSGSNLDLDEVEEEEQYQHHQKQARENLLKEQKRGSSSSLELLGGGNTPSERQGDSIFQFDDTDHGHDTESHKNLNRNLKDKEEKSDKARKGAGKKYIPVPVPLPIDISSGSGGRKYYPRRDSFVSEDEDDNNHPSRERGKGPGQDKDDIRPWESKSLPPSPSSASPLLHPHLHAHRNGKFVAARLLNHHNIGRDSSPYLTTEPATTTATASSSGERLHSLSLANRGGGTGTGTGASSEEQFKLELDDESEPNSPLTVRGGIGIGIKQTKEEARAQMQNLWSHLRRIKNQGGIGAGSGRQSGQSTGGYSSTGSAVSEEYGSAEIHEAQVVDLDLRRKMELYRRGNCPYCGGPVHLGNVGGNLDLNLREGEGARYFCGNCRADLRGVQGAAVETEIQRRPERGFDAATPYITGQGRSERTVNVPPVTKPPKPLSERAFLDQRSTNGGRERGLGGASSRAHGQETLVQQNNGPDRIPSRDPIPINRKPQPVPINARKYEQEAPTSKFSYASSVESSPSSASRSPVPRKAPPRLADRPFLQEAKQPSSPSLAEQLRQRPPPPPPERVVYASDSRNARVHHRAILAQQSRAGAREAGKQISAPNLGGKQPAPSPLRHEITQRQATHHSGPLLPSTVYRPLPPLPVEQQQPGSQTAPLSQSQKFGLPHRPNHSSPLLNQAFTPGRPSPHAPGPPRPTLSPPTTTATTASGRPRQETFQMSPQPQYETIPDPRYVAASGGYIQQQPTRQAVQSADPKKDLYKLSKPNSNLLASALEQAIRNKQTQHTASEQPGSASSSTYSLFNDSPTTPTAPTFGHGTNTFGTNTPTFTAGNPAAAAAAAAAGATAPHFYGSHLRSGSFSSDYRETLQSQSQAQYNQVHPQNALHITTPTPEPRTDSQGQAQSRAQINQGGSGSATAEITPSSAQIPMLRYDDSIMPWLTAEDKANFEKAIVEKGDDAQVYMDIFDDYAGYSSSVSSSTDDGHQDGRQDGQQHGKGQEDKGGEKDTKEMGIGMEYAI